jgi:uncharacterized protein with PIN domain
MGEWLLRLLAFKVYRFGHWVQQSVGARLLDWANALRDKQRGARRMEPEIGEECPNCKAYIQPIIHEAIDDEWEDGEGSYVQDIMTWLECPECHASYDWSGPDLSEMDIVPGP